MLPLNVEKEWARLQDALVDLQERRLVVLERLTQPTVAGLQQRLRQGDIHIFHFVGHGEFDAGMNSGGLFFEDSLGSHHFVAASVLGTLLHDHAPLRLVFLNACEGGRGGSVAPFSGMAQTLVQQGIPAVLAMQFGVGDAAAIALAHEFYRSIADGAGVDMAVSEARKAVYATGNALEWATPVLFSRAADGKLFEFPKEESRPTAVQSSAIEPIPVSLLDVPFIGPVPFNIAVSKLYFGRNKEIDRVVNLLFRRTIPLLVINGLSGSGKTSLLRAGVIPRLEAEGHTVIYASILDNPQSDVLRAFEAHPTAANIPTVQDIVQAVNSLASTYPSSSLFLVIDQVERCFTLSKTDFARNNFWRDIARILRGDTKVRAKLVLAVRSDWLYAFQSVTPFPIDIPIFEYLYLVERLTGAQAHEAFTGPLALFGIQFDPEAIDTIVTDLTMADGFVNPPQLQVVGAALYEHLQDKHRPDEPLELGLQDYKELHGAATILRQHLLKIVKSLGPSERACWQILFKLVSDDDLRVSRHEEELRGNLSDDVFQPVIASLVRYSLVVRDISSDDSSPIYTLTHDYLVGEIKNHFESDHTLQALRTSEHYLETGLRDLQNVRRE